MKFYAGEIVFSTAGRDKGRPFVVLSVLNPDFVILSDGRKRTVSKPKKKKTKHLRKSGCTSAYIQKKLAEDITVTNPDLKKVLAEFLKDYEA